MAENNSTVLLASAARTATVATADQSNTAGVPFTWAASDEINVNGCYEAATS